MTDGEFTQILNGIVDQISQNSLIISIVLAAVFLVASLVYNSRNGKGA